MLRKGFYKASTTCSALVLAVLLTLGVAVRIEAYTHSSVFPPHANPYGKTYGEWAALYFQTEFSTVWDPEACSSGRIGNVEILQSTLGGPGEWECDVPAGTAFVFPVITTFFLCPTDCGPGGAAPNGTVEELRAAAAIIGDAELTMGCEIDGVPVENLLMYRSQSPVFEGQILEGCVFNVADSVAFPPGPYGPAVTDGYFLVVHPLPPGEHTIHYHAIVGPISEPIFETESTHHITVVPEHGREAGAAAVEPATWGAIKAAFH
jgi:hypothetical protein